VRGGSLAFKVALTLDLLILCRVDVAGDQGDSPVTTVQMTLPDDLAQELATAGLLEPQVIEALPRDRLRAAHIANFAKMRAVLKADPIPPMTNDEINAEIHAYRAEQRRASGS
jgi:DNA repair photolyase